jgi:hypothetical protein
MSRLEGGQDCQGIKDEIQDEKHVIQDCPVAKTFTDVTNPDIRLRSQPRNPLIFKFI